MHRVQFYNHDKYLLSSVVEHLSGVLLGGGVGGSGASTGVGLTSIRERLRELGGGCPISSGPQGTSLRISVSVN